MRIRMTRRAVGCLLVIAISRAGAQKPVDTGLVPFANTRDVVTADAIITALYDANSVMVDQKRDTARFRSLFLPDARLMPTLHVGNDVVRIATETVDQYITGAMRGQPRGGFSEREIARTSDAFGSIMQVFSTYESHRNATDKNPVRGINSIQLFNDGSRWYVVTVMWDNERSGQTIPATYLPGKKSP